MKTRMNNITAIVETTRILSIIDTAHIFIRLCCAIKYWLFALITEENMVIVFMVIRGRLCLRAPTFVER